ncbi:putative Alpha-(1,3)-fucosyltransferase 11 [Cardiosporidium cionae]|uniref:Fucosyltransferase n=1 Tax=Cardiosporidium cionae TaxID=476202 RepID=A0ABQ7J4A9_9APIC|nr:putative Alpha-(1,3)-fucosyltransferase 11 [Cardiosporidium cionae]|eukprot:KAF8817913.1 putative Alpha-(1,3)-fucosyltransferase 11 [Cardiosporidium cionae]
MVKARENCPSDVYKPFPTQVNNRSAILIFQKDLWWTRKADLSGVKDCSNFPVVCEWTMDLAQYDKADAVAYHFAGPWSPPDANKLSIGFCREAFFDHLHHFYPTTNEPSHWQYNVSATHQLKSEIPFHYVRMHSVELGRKRRPVFKEMERAATLISSRCRSYTQRLELAQLLAKQIPVYFYGKCLNNKEWPSDVGKNDLQGLMGRHILNFAFENTNSEDYVTEKLFNALASGAIPVYHGTNTVDKFLPSPDSIIRVSDFKSVEALGNYLKRVISDEALFNFHHSWRYKELPNTLLDRFEFIKERWECRVCKYVYSRKFGCFWDHKRQQIGGPLLEFSRAD